jgi:hypothetical protein
MGEVMAESKVQGETTTVDPSVVIASLQQEIAAAKEKLSHSVQMKLQYQGSIDGPPCAPQALYQKACSNDGVTITSWKDIWLDHVRKNNAKYNFFDNSVMKDFKKYEYHPAIVAGSGPSLKKNAHHLLKKPKEIPLVSCLHNFGYFEDMGLDVECYINLDAGDITIPEMCQGGSKPEQWYWDKTSERTLCTSVCGNPKLIEKWRGRVLFFNSIVPDKEYLDEYTKITKFLLAYNVGGNTLGACLYHARAILGCMPIAFIGADFAFDYMRKFHPFDTPYDQQFAGVVPCTDVWGNRVYAWPSYTNFKSIFEYFALGGHLGKPPVFINCTEGGIFGSYNEGNIRQVIQMLLQDFLHMYCCHSEMESIAKDTDQLRFIY